MDAWLVVNNLDKLSNNDELAGFTGNLVLTNDGRIQRKLLWAKYQEGKSVRLKNVEFEPTNLIINRQE